MSGHLGGRTGAAGLAAGCRRGSNADLRLAAGAAAGGIGTDKGIGGGARQGGRGPGAAGGDATDAGRQHAGVSVA